MLCHAVHERRLGSPLRTAHAHIPYHIGCNSVRVQCCIARAVYARCTCSIQTAFTWCSYAWQFTVQLAVIALHSDTRT
eukprot:15476714-Alexandrium_andersonii.AAC.1